MENSQKTLKQLIQEGAFLVDVREPSELVTDGSVKGAVNIPLGTVANNLAVFEGKNHIIVYCRSGNRSGQAKVILEKHGITNVTNGGTWMQVNEFVK
jgi:rhodanese-related sulfurtransferase